MKKSRGYKKKLGFFFLLLLSLSSLLITVARLTDFQRFASAATSGVETRMIDGQEYFSHGKDSLEILKETPQSTSLSRMNATSVPCLGNGADGPRVQVLYTYGKNTQSRYAERLPMIREATAGISDLINQTAQKTGGQRVIRYVTTPDCEVDVKEVGLTQQEFDFWGTISELKSLGFSAQNRKYLIWSDYNWGCGYSTTIWDDKPGWENKANFDISYGMIGNNCFIWHDKPVIDIPLHELMHGLGAIQPSAPNKGPDGGFHCIDGKDLLCYNDSANNVVSIVCPEWGVDCNNDDYFSLNPPVGSYLATHWNVAYSVFFDDPTRDPIVDPGEGGRNGIRLGEKISLTLSGFQPDEPVVVRLDDTKLLKTVTVGTDGSWAGKFEIPDKNARGDRQLVIRGSKGSFAEAIIRIRR